MAQDKARLIEAAFPLKQTSIDSVHEKNVRHGHISTLHIWPARRPLAACRAALIATLLPDPGTPEKRKELCEKIGGKIVKVIKRKILPSGKEEEKVVEETQGGILHWGRERENREDLDWFRREIRKAYGGRAPKVLDPFAGGGAIPLEAMRLGCEVTASDINPVAWFILKCTLEYPQKLAGKRRPLPDFALKDPEFMEAFFKAQGMPPAMVRTQLGKLGLEEATGQRSLVLDLEPHTIEADLAWHVRAWGLWVLREARRDLARFYPVYADFQSLERGKPYEPRPMQKVPLREDGTSDVDALNVEFDEEYLSGRTNPRWVAKPTVAYLWARTVRCKNCRATIPLLKTRWLAKKSTKRVLLAMQPSADGTGVTFGVQDDVPPVGGNAAQRREHDRKIGQGTISRSGAWCPCCGKPGTVAMTTADIRREGQAGRLGSQMTAVVVAAKGGRKKETKEYRLPVEEEIRLAQEAESRLDEVFSEIPFGIPEEPTPKGGGSGAGRAFSVQGYGMRRWRDLFTPRQLLALGTLGTHFRRLTAQLEDLRPEEEMTEAIVAYLGLAFGRTVNYMSTQCLWESKATEVKQTFLRFALPITWDFAEANPLAEADRYYLGAIGGVSTALRNLLSAAMAAPPATVIRRSALAPVAETYDVLFTDPPYYDAIPYSDLMDFFYVWLRRILAGTITGDSTNFQDSLGPKWDHVLSDGELIDDPSRHGKDAKKSRGTYETGMARALNACAQKLAPTGRAVIVFANKQPEAWETLVGAVISAGFVVVGSLPIMTEMRGGVRNFGRASLSSSIWLVCGKRQDGMAAGWDNAVLDEMRTRIADRLRQFWDDGIRGPDLVWAATGPALEAYSKHPFVKKADAPGKRMDVSEFLRHVRRIVVDFVVGRVIGGVPGSSDGDGVGGLDDVTTYYLLHRHEFGVADAPAGACILYALSCNLYEGDLADRHDILLRTGGRGGATGAEAAEGDESGESAGPGGGTGSAFRLKTWKQRKGRRLGEEGVGGASPPLVDQVHHLMHLWRGGDVAKVDRYVDERGLGDKELFHRLLQAIIELSPEASEERSLLESISNHVQARKVREVVEQTDLPDPGAPGAPGIGGTRT